MISARNQTHIEQVTSETPRSYSRRLASFAVALLLSVVLALTGIPAFAQQRAESRTSSALQLDLQIQGLVRTLSHSLITVQVASRTSPFQVALANPTANGAGQPVFLRNVSAVVVDSGRYLICAAALLSDQDSLWLVREGQRYPVERIGIDYRSGLALLKTNAPNLDPAIYENQPPSTGALALFLKTSGPESVEPTLTISSGQSAVDGYLEFNGPVGSGTVGGAFFNMDGRLLGLALGSVSSAGSSNRVFVLPVSRIEPIITRLKCCGDRQAGYLGVQVVNTQIRGVDLSLRRSYGSINADGDNSQSYSARTGSVQLHLIAGADNSGPDSPQDRIANGALITVVEENSPAEKAGVKVGDVVFRYDNQPVESASAFRDYVRGCAPDSVISLAFLRGSRQIVVNARLSSAPLQIIAGDDIQPATGASVSGAKNSYDSLLNRIRDLEKRLRILEERR